MRKRKFPLIESVIITIILMVLLLAGLGIYLYGRNYIPAEPEPKYKSVRKQALMLLIEEEETLLNTMHSYSQGNTAFLNYIAEYTCINALHMPSDGLWAFELDATKGSALGGCYYDLFYCEDDPVDLIYDWFGDRSGMWKDMGKIRMYNHKGNEIYLEELGNNFWFGYCYC